MAAYHDSPATHLPGAHHGRGGNNVWVEAKVEEQSKLFEEPDRAITLDLHVKIGWIDRSGHTHSVSDYAEFDTIVGPTGMDPKTVIAREQMREAMTHMLRELARTAADDYGLDVSHVMKFGEEPILKASGE